MTSVEQARLMTALKISDEWKTEASD